MSKLHYFPLHAPARRTSRPSMSLSLECISVESQSNTATKISSANWRSRLSLHLHPPRLEFELLNTGIAFHFLLHEMSFSILAFSFSIPSFSLSTASGSGDIVLRLAATPASDDATRSAADRFFAARLGIESDMHRQTCGAFHKLKTENGDRRAPNHCMGGRTKDLGVWVGYIRVTCRDLLHSPNHTSKERPGVSCFQINEASFGSSDWRLWDSNGLYSFGAKIIFQICSLSR
jgi:hypothetical protein